MGKLDGRVAILSGGAGGIAFEEARLFLQEGAKVILGDIRDELGRKAEAELAETGGDVSYHRLDVTSEDDWSQPSSGWLKAGTASWTSWSTTPE